MAIIYCFLNADLCYRFYLYLYLYFLCHVSKLKIFQLKLSRVPCLSKKNFFACVCLYFESLENDERILLEIFTLILI